MKFKQNEIVLNFRLIIRNFPELSTFSAGRRVCRAPAIARIGALEHEADDAERTLAASAVQHAGDFRQLHLFAAVGDKLEAAADALKHASLILREQVLEHVIDG